jgi:quinol monooxygenase YgiN
MVGALPYMKKEEPGTLSFCVIEDLNNENVAYVFERFADKEAMESHRKGAKVMANARPYVDRFEDEFFNEVQGFLSKDE